MPTTIKFTLDGTDVRLVEALHAKRDRMISALVDKMTLQMLELQKKVQLKLSGGVIGNKGGVLVNSVRTQPATFDGSVVEGSVSAAGGAASYGQVFEKGGTTWYRILPVNKKALRLMAAPGIIQVLHGELSSKEVILASVWHPPAAKRPFMAPSLAESIGDIKAGLMETVAGVLRS